MCLSVDRPIFLYYLGLLSNCANKDNLEMYHARKNASTRRCKWLMLNVSELSELIE